MINKKGGFTLIELAIALVIIGLIAGGVLMGKDLIRASELRDLISEVNNHKTVINAFKTKYNALPGDMENATDFFDMPGTCFGTCNGNGNKQLSDIEARFFYVHASQAGLMPGDFTGVYAGNPQPGSELGVVPACKACVFRPLYHVAGAGGGYWRKTGNAIALRGLQAAVNGGYTSGLLPAEAKNVDTKMDDGLPFSGQVYGYDYHACIEGTNEYEITRTWASCAMAFYWEN